MTFEARLTGATLADTLLGCGNGTDQSAEPSRPQHRHHVLAFVGMAFEAKIAAGPGVLVLTRHSRHELSVTAKHAARVGCRGMISFGVAGGLASHLRPGDWIVASTIVDADRAHPTDAAWSSRLRDAIRGASFSPIMGVDEPVAEPETKRTLHRRTGAAAVDMESHVVARVAAEHGLAFTALRVIVDPADRTIPPAALLGMGSGARADAAAVLREVIARPAQLSGLLRVSLDAYLARSEMLRVRQLLGPQFGLVDASRTEPAQSAFAVPDLTTQGLAASEVAGYRSPA